jgi:hypothetical protein
MTVKKLATNKNVYVGNYMKINIVYQYYVNAILDIFCVLI